MTSRLASVTFKMASTVFIEETDKNFGLSKLGDLGDQQRPTLEKNDMKLGPFNCARGLFVACF